jgi:hypothetical protein
MQKKEELKDNLLELSADGADIALDLLFKSELLKDIPVAGLIYKFGKTIGSIPDALFLQKVGRFIQVVNDHTTQDQRINFSEKLKADKKERDLLYGNIFLKIDKFDNLSKSNVFAKIFSCFIVNKIRKEEFLSLSSALNLLSFEDLTKFSKSYWENRSRFHMEAYGKNERGYYYGNLLSSSFVVLALDNKRVRSESPTLIANLGFTVTELGALYAYIVEDFDDFFVMNDLQRRQYLNELYTFESSYENREFRDRVLDKFPLD